MLIIDSLAYRSRFRTVHPGKKVLAAGILLILSVTAQSIALGILMSVSLGILSVWGGGTPLKLYIRLLRVPLIFIGLSLAAILINVGLEPAAGLSVSLGPVYVSLQAGGIYRGAKLAAGAFGAVSALYFLALSTPLTDIFYVLEKIKCPYLIIELMLLIYRFLFLLWFIAVEMNRAAESRLGNVDLKTAVRTSGQMFAALFIRALRRSSAIYDAMESRGYDGRIRVLPGRWADRRKRQDGDRDE